MMPSMRKQVREKYDLPATPAGDCISWFCCCGLTVYQEAREISLRGAAGSAQLQQGTVQVVTHAPQQVQY